MKNLTSLMMVGIIWLTTILGCANSGTKSTNTQTSSTPAVNKPQCKITKEQLSEIRGFYLGMNLSEILKRFPAIKYHGPDKFGYEEFQFENLDFAPPLVKIEGKERFDQFGVAVVSPIRHPEFKDVQLIDIGFLDKQIIWMNFQYPRVSGLSLDEFQERVRESLKLPVKFDKNTGSISCNGFKVEAKEGIDIHVVRVEDMVADATLKQRQKQSEEDTEMKERQEREKRAREFKP